MVKWSLPVKTEHMKRQAEHQPSHDYARDIYRVASRLANFTALEVGAAWGLSTLAILEAGAKHLLSVDPNERCQGEAEARANGYDNYLWTHCRSDKFWQENTEAKWDLIYIDGSHSYEEVKNDLYKAWERLNFNGLLLADDWDHKNNQKVNTVGVVDYGVSLACWEFWRDHPEVVDVGIEGRVLRFKK